MTRTLTLRSGDLFPSIHKFGIGFDRMFDELLKQTEQQSTNYPPYNVVKQSEDQFYIELAVAGFKEGEISVQLNDRVLSITSTKEDSAEPEYLHRGISSRNFSRQFTLAEHVEVVTATVENGILTVYLERKIPEERKPKTIAINYNK